MLNALTVLLPSGSCPDIDSSLAHYVVLQTTNVGHVQTEMFERGFKNHLGRLVIAGRHTNAIECVANVTPLFFRDGIDSLLGCGDFLTVVKDIVSADRTVMNMAKELVSNFQPGEILSDFKDMVAMQIADFKR